MRTLSGVSFLLATILWFGCSTSPREGATEIATGDIIIDVTCSDPAMQFTGSIISDGRSARLTGTGSGTFQAHGHTILCSFKKTAAEGRISLSVSEGGKSLGASSNRERFGGVRAEIIRKRGRLQTTFTTY